MEIGGGGGTRRGIKARSFRAFASSAITVGCALTGGRSEAAAVSAAGEGPGDDAGRNINSTNNPTQSAASSGAARRMMQVTFMAEIGRVTAT
jgi:hypothetical protein